MSCDWSVRFTLDREVSHKFPGEERHLQEFHEEIVRIMHEAFGGEDIDFDIVDISYSGVNSYLLTPEEKAEEEIWKEADRRYDEEKIARG
jgi:hypothetical protein